MKIAYIAASFIPSQTANSVHVMKMCQAFAANGNEVVLIIPNRKKANLEVEKIYDIYGVKNCFRIMRLPFRGGKIGFLVFSLLSVLKAKKEGAELIYTRFVYSAFFSSILNFPTVYEVHSVFVNRMEKIFFHFIDKDRLKKIIVISVYLSKYFREKYGISADKIEVAPDGADPVEERASKKIGGGGLFSVGYVGSLYKGRGVEIIAEMAKRCRWAKFRVIGGSSREVNYWKKLLSCDNLEFTGYRPHREVSELMLDFDVLVAPYQKKVTIQDKGNSCQWMSPLKIFEYMAAGKPIIASDLPAIKEVLTHKKNALLAAPDNVEKWVENLELIRDNARIGIELGENARKDFLEKYTWKARVAKILSSLV